MSHIGLAHKKSITNNYKIDEESVQAGSIAKIDIANVLSSIEMYELAID